jgi:hypothetical protein
MMPLGQEMLGTRTDIFRLGIKDGVQVSVF